MHMQAKEPTLQAPHLNTCIIEVRLFFSYAAVCSAVQKEAHQHRHSCLSQVDCFCGVTSLTHQKLRIAAPIHSNGVMLMCL